MKIRVRKKSYEQVMAMPRAKHRKPMRPLFLLSLVIRVLAIFDLMRTKFTYRTHRMELVDKKEPCLILMNHSSFIDLKIVSKIFFPKRYCIVCTSDGFVGKNWLMRLIGCIPTQKFVSDVGLIRDMRYTLKELKTSILMYPEASYSFDGTATPLPRKLGVVLKKLDVPVVGVITKGAFHHDPLYNGLQLRKVKVSADVSCVLTREEIREKSVEELDAILDQLFSFDNFAWQYENGVEIDETFRADGLNRILYKCPHCGTEGKMEGKGIKLRCHHCGKTYGLSTLGRLVAEGGKPAFEHIPDWYRWQREEVKKEIENGSYRLDVDVDICAMVNYKAIYRIGEGRLVHDENGFHLTGCDGKLDYVQSPLACYSVYSDYLWYEIGDVICIGNKDCLYYCFPKSGDVVAKTRLAQEELYKLKKPKRVAPKGKTLVTVGSELPETKV